MLLIGLTTFQYGCAQADSPDSGLLTQEELLAAMQGGEVPLILDVRSAQEFSDGHVPGAVNIEYTQLAERLDEIASRKERPVVVYCETGVRAGIAEKILKRGGFRQVRHLEGDMRAWRERGRPVQGF